MGLDLFHTVPCQTNQTYCTTQWLPSSQKREMTQRVKEKPWASFSPKSNLYQMSLYFVLCSLLFVQLHIAHVSPNELDFLIKLTIVLLKWINQGWCECILNGAWILWSHCLVVFFFFFFNQMSTHLHTSIFKVAGCCSTKCKKTSFFLLALCTKRIELQKFKRQ